MHRMQSGLHETTDVHMAFDMLDRTKCGSIGAEDLVEMFKAYEEPLELEEAKVRARRPCHLLVQTKSATWWRLLRVVFAAIGLGRTW